MTKPIQGIFTKWNGLNFLEKPDSSLRKKLESNPIYPFEETETGVYVVTVRSARLGIGILLCLLAVGSTIAIYIDMGSVEEMVIFPIVIGIVFFSHGMSHTKSRSYVLDSNRKMYEFYHGRRLIYRGHFHNVYIRLKGQNSGGGDVYYSVVLGGFQMEEYSITRPMTIPRRLAKLGRRLAHRLDLNYFDALDRSTEHVIRHKCPYSIYD